MPNGRLPIAPEDRRRMGERFSNARMHARLSMREVAEAVGVTVNAVTQWEHGALPGAEYRASLATLLGIKENKLFAEYFSALAEVKAALTS